MMEEIRIIEKPSYITYDVIKDVLINAHKTNFEKGIILHTTQLSPEELEQRIGEKGKCFVAMCGEKVIGTASYRVVERNLWYAHEKVVDEILVGVCTEYKGRHIYSRLYDAIERSAISNGFNIIVFNTAEKNINKQRICEKKGFNYVSYFVANDNDHYSVVMAKWINGCPYSKLRLIFEYSIKRLYVRIRYKPGKIKRFGI